MAFKGPFQPRLSCDSVEVIHLHCQVEMTITLANIKGIYAVAILLNLNASVR